LQVAGEGAAVRASLDPVTALPRFHRIPRRGLGMGLRHAHLGLPWVLVILVVLAVLVVTLRRRG
jgi:hypothetical protein